MAVKRPKLSERDLMFERLAGARMIIPSISGYNHAHQTALEIAAYMSIVEGKTLDGQAFSKLERGLREGKVEEAKKRRAKARRQSRKESGR